MYICMYVCIYIYIYIYLAVYSQSAAWVFALGSTHIAPHNNKHTPLPYAHSLTYRRPDAVICGVVSSSP